MILKTYGQSTGHLLFCIQNSLAQCVRGVGKMTDICTFKNRVDDIKGVRTANWPSPVLYPECTGSVSKKARPRAAG
jgi:hypothetical protein